MVPEDESADGVAASLLLLKQGKAWHSYTMFCCRGGVNAATAVHRSIPQHRSGPWVL